MECNEFERRWQQLLDEREVPERDAELTAHALLCERCRELLTFGPPWPARTSLDRAVPAAQTDHAEPVMLADRVVSAWKAEAASNAASPRLTKISQRAARPSSRWYSTAVAAVLVLSASGLVYRTTAALRSEIDGRAPQLVLGTADPAAATVAEPLAVGEPASEMHAPPQFASYQQLLDSLSTDLKAIPRQSVVDITGSLRPVADSVGSALNALRRSLPLGERSPPAGKPQASYVATPVTV